MNVDFGSGDFTVECWITKHRHIRYWKRKVMVFFKYTITDVIKHQP